MPALPVAVWAWAWGEKIEPVGVPAVTVLAGEWRGCDLSGESNFGSLGWCDIDRRETGESKGFILE